MERIAPATPSAEVVDQLVTGLEQMRGDDGGDSDLAFGPLADEADVRAPGEAPGDARVQVALVDAVLAYGGWRARLFDEVAAAATSELPGTTRVRQVVAAPQNMREQPLVELGGRFDQVAHGRGQGPPAVDAVHPVDPARADLAAMVEEGLTGTRVEVTPHLCRSGGRSAPE